jgi:hypothetical protein
MVGKAMDESKVKHLELIQGVINRLAGNSFLLKSWTVTLTAALFVLSAQGSDITFAFVAPFSTLTFWGLDAYYLRQERLYRLLYNHVAVESEITSETVPPFSLNISRYKKQCDNWFATLWSPTIFSVHGLAFIFVLTMISVKIFLP